MKPPQLTNYRICFVLVLAAMLCSASCKRPEQQTAPPKSPEASTTPEASDPPRESIDQSPVEEPQPDRPLPSVGGPVDEQPAVKPADPEDEESPDMEEELHSTEVPPTELGPPLGEDVTKLVQLQPNPVLWIDQEGRRVILLGQVCQRNALLEMFACTRGTKEHESVVVIPTKAEFIHAALMAVGAEAGRPVQFHPEYVPASGTEIEILVRWKDEQGEIRTARAQEWIRDMHTKKAMETNWVFAGSSYWVNEQTGQRHYQADSGDLICVSNFPSAMLDLPIESSQREGELLFEAFTENIPPLGTPVTVILAPKLAKADTVREE
ncbi:MAG: hypothetical protein GX621_01650 [Pirellulaceae bacterium]|nr:hypothetical protein [Pirellulaceae bacterium]